MEATKAIEETTDPLVRFLANYNPAHGLSPYNVWRQTYGPCIGRDWVSGESAIADYQVPDGWLLCQGAAVGLDDKGIAYHIRPKRSLKGFVGFVLRQGEKERVGIRTRGIVQVCIPGVTPESIGKAVYVSDVNCFNLISEGLECGVVTAIQPDRKDTCQMAFKSFLDPKPLPVPEMSIR